MASRLSYDNVRFRYFSSGLVFIDISHTLFTYRVSYNVSFSGSIVAESYIRCSRKIRNLKSGYD